MRGGGTSKVTLQLLADFFYPIGSIYETLNNDFDPNVEWSGTWVKIEDKFLIGASDTYLTSSEGGEATHKLTTSEMPSHRHRVVWFGTVAGDGYSGEEAYPCITVSAPYNRSQYIGFQAEGGSQAHNNLPPYKAVNIWQRTS